MEGIKAVMSSKSSSQRWELMGNAVGKPSRVGMGMYSLALWDVTLEEYVWEKNIRT